MESTRGLVQEYKSTRVQEYKSTRVHEGWLYPLVNPVCQHGEYKRISTRVQEYKSTRVQEYKSTWRLTLSFG